MELTSTKLGKFVAEPEATITKVSKRMNSKYSIRNQAW